MRKKQSYWLDCPYCHYAFTGEDVFYGKTGLPTEPIKENEGDCEVKCPACGEVFTVGVNLELTYDVGSENE